MRDQVQGLWSNWSREFVQTQFSISFPTPPEFHAVGGFATCHQPQYPASFMLLFACPPNVSSYVAT